MVYGVQPNSGFKIIQQIENKLLNTTKLGQKKL